MAVETQLLVRADVEQTTRRVIRTRGEGVPVREKLMTMVNHIWVPISHGRMSRGFYRDSVDVGLMTGEGLLALALSNVP